MTTIELPRTAGSRERADELTSVLSGDLKAQTVVLEAQCMKAGAQSFADQLCKQILEVRGAERLEVRHATPMFARYLSNSARIRRVADRLSIETRVLQAA